MNLDQAKQEFIHTWGKLGAEWWINRTMAQIHALLLVSDEPLSTDDVIRDLQVSRGNANMNLRALLDWGLIAKEIRSGERREYFLAQKDVWEIARIIATERRKRELDPLMRSLDHLLQAAESDEAKQEELDAFKGLVNDILDLGRKGDLLLDLVLKLDRMNFFQSILKFRKSGK